MGCEESRVTAPTNGARNHTAWAPYSFFEAELDWETTGRPPFALLILNLQITNKKFFAALWKNSRLQVCADGGANRLYDSLDEKERAQFLPDRIIGDLDSVRDDVRAYYQARGVKITQDSDQDSTDFGKCMKYIATHDPPDSFVTPSTVQASLSAEGVRVQHPKMTVVALGGFGGRVDQSFHSIHAMYVAQQGPGLPRQMYLVSDQNVTFLLAKGLNLIRTPLSTLGPCCGIIPVGGPSTITTQGLEWNLTNAETKFGGLVSTSNHTVADDVSIETTEPVVFTIEFRDLDP
ncbi:thiamine pyrophosphokinase [Sphaerosporella brunnea]|uniref:Thiamine pyrophosphokinase n=1 Tax=Sphaerosporella brunnea TaxID=1250544 RepID=A0A5J5EXV7_9PEZI|nr:thiamine pyrophosphokinase [Sphaerosporella brunnea]